MITVGMNYKVIPGKEQDFEDKFAAVVDALNAAEGHTKSNLWRAVERRVNSSKTIWHRFRGWFGKDPTPLLVEDDDDDVANQEVNSYLITSDWNDEAAFGAFIRSDEFRAVTDWGSEQILAGRPSHTVYKHSSPVGPPGQ